MLGDIQHSRRGAIRRRRYIWTFSLFLISFIVVLWFRGVDSSAVRGGTTNSVKNWWRVYIKDDADLKVDELKALLYMLTTSDQILPEHLDTSQPTDLTILSYGQTWNPREWHQRSVLVDRFNPLIVFSKSYCPYSMKAKALLEAYDIHPPPRIVEVDHRPDMEQIKGILSRLTSRSTWPNIVLKGVSIGGSDDIHALHEKGLLRERLEKAGISLGSEASHYAADGVTRASRKNGKVPENETS